MTVSDEHRPGMVLVPMSEVPCIPLVPVLLGETNQRQHRLPARIVMANQQCVSSLASR